MLQFLTPSSSAQYTALACAGLSILVTVVKVGYMEAVLCMLGTWFFIYVNLSCLVGTTACPVWGWLSLIGPIIMTVCIIFMGGAATRAGLLTRKDRRRK